MSVHMCGSGGGGRGTYIFSPGNKFLQFLSASDKKNTSTVKCGEKKKFLVSNLKINSKSI